MTNKKKLGLIVLAFIIYTINLVLYTLPVVNMSAIIYGLVCVLLLIGLILLLSFHIGILMDEKNVTALDVIIILLSVAFILWLCFNIIEIYLLIPTL